MTNFTIFTSSYECKFNVPFTAVCHSRLTLVHTSDISIRTRSIRFFVRFLAYASTMILCLCLRRFLYRRLDFVPLFCPYAYAYVQV